MIEFAHAKINLALNVLNKREDGYHNIESIMFPIELHDTIEIEVAKRQGAITDSITCDNYSVGISKYNLCHKAIDEARKKWGFKQFFDVNIHKNIFLQSGLGGGSSDAVAVIRALLKILKIKAKEKDILEVCLNIGSDLPFMYYRTPALVEGRGEKITPIKVNEEFLNYNIVLIKPKEGISTTRIYGEYDDFKEKEQCDIKKVVKSLEEGTDEFKNIIVNGLEKPGYIIVPEIKNIVNNLKEKGFDAVFMTGGGSCVVGLSKNKHLCMKTLKEYYKKKEHQIEITKFYREKR